MAEHDHPEHAEDEVLEHHDKFYIQATSSRTDDRTRVLKHGQMFAVFDRFGDVQPVGLGEQGVYHDGTRFLSRLELRIGGRRPLLLSSTVKKENDLLAVDLSNPDLKEVGGSLTLPRGELHVFRSTFLHRGVCYQRLRVSSFSREKFTVDLRIDFDADFADIFEVRGAKRARRGQRLSEVASETTLIFGYQGLDGVGRRTRIQFDPAPRELSSRQARYHLELAPRQSVTLLVSVACQIGDDAQSPETHEHALAALTSELASAAFSRCRIHATSDDLDEWLARSISDLQMMITATPDGPYPYAGVPWFSTPFGRDGIITAMEVLWIAPEIARGVLSYLAVNQARECSPERDAQPGKILHEARGGEMAALGEVPFGRYYGSVDATPLFVMLAAAYLRRTGDLAFVRALAPHVDHALAWIERDGDADGDGFVEYARATDKGLVQQGWKDSHDSVFHADGALAEGPIALCEVQGYVYGAFRGAAEIAAALGHAARAEAYLRKAQILRARFDRDVLGRSAWDVRAGARRHQAPLSGAKLERRPRALDRDRRTGARPSRGRVAHERGELLRLGDPDAGRLRGALQSDVVPQRVGLAARQRAHRRRVRQLRLRRSRRCACSNRCWAPARWSICTGCPSCSAASCAGRARGRRCIRSPAHRRPGRRARCSCCSARRWASPSTARAARCHSSTPCCRPPSASCESPASRSAAAASTCCLKTTPTTSG